MTTMTTDSSISNTNEEDYDASVPLPDVEAAASSSNSPNTNQRDTHGELQQHDDDDDLSMIPRNCCCCCCRVFSIPGVDVCLCAPKRTPFYPNQQRRFKQQQEQNHEHDQSCCSLVSLLFNSYSIPLAQLLMLLATAFSLWGLVDCDYVHAKSSIVDEFLVQEIQHSELFVDREHTSLGFFFFQDTDGSCACNVYSNENNSTLEEEGPWVPLGDYTDEPLDDESNSGLPIDLNTLSDTAYYYNPNNNQEDEEPGGNEEITGFTPLPTFGGGGSSNNNNNGSSSNNSGGSKPKNPDSYTSEVEEEEIGNLDTTNNSTDGDDARQDSGIQEISPIPPLGGGGRNSNGQSLFQDYSDYLGPEWKAARIVLAVACALSVLWTGLLLTYTCLSHTRRLRQVWAGVAIAVLAPLHVISFPLVWNSDFCHQADCIVGQAAVMPFLAVPLYWTAALLILYGTRNYYPDMERFERPNHEICVDNDHVCPLPRHAFGESDEPQQQQRVVSGGGTVSTMDSSTRHDEERQQQHEEAEEHQRDGLGDAQEVAVPLTALQAMIQPDAARSSDHGSSSDYNDND